MAHTALLEYNTEGGHRKPSAQQTTKPATKQKKEMSKSPVRHAMITTGRTSTENCALSTEHLVLNT